TYETPARGARAAARSRADPRHRRVRTVGPPHRNHWFFRIASTSAHSSLRPTGSSLHRHTPPPDGGTLASHGGPEHSRHHRTGAACRPMSASPLERIAPALASIAGTGHERATEAARDVPGFRPMLWLLSAFWVYVAISNVLYATSMQASLSNLK